MNKYATNPPPQQQQQQHQQQFMPHQQVGFPFNFPNGFVDAQQQQQLFLEMLYQQQQQQQAQYPFNFSLPPPQQQHPHHQQQQQQQDPDVEKFKTELCRKFSQTGSCRYGDQCQFAHGQSELRSIHRHPLYKTSNCKSFEATGTCRYGIRCRFIHNEERLPPTTPLHYPLDAPSYMMMMSSTSSSTTPIVSPSFKSLSSQRRPSALMLDEARMVSTPLRNSHSMVTLSVPPPNSSTSKNSSPSHSLLFQGARSKSFGQVKEARTSFSDFQVTQQYQSSPIQSPPHSPAIKTVPRSASYATGIWGLTLESLSPSSSVFPTSKSTLGLQSEEGWKDIALAKKLPHSVSQESRLDKQYATNHTSRLDRKISAEQVGLDIGLDMDSEDDGGF